ncbi:hypothetical protein BsWGS_10146 [Bradybaena similaris]
MAFSLPGDTSRDEVTTGQIWGLCSGASLGDVRKLRSYIYKKGIVLNANDRIGAGALMLATTQGHAKSLKALIAAGADVNMSPSEQKMQLPLMAAAERGDVDCLIALLEGGANVNAVRHDGQNSLALAIQEGCSDDVKNIIDVKTQVRPRPFMGSLVMPANRSWKEQHEECALLLLQAGANIGYTNDSGYSLLMFSAANGYIKTVKTLLQAGANVNQATNDGTTALQLACRCTTLLDYRLYKECVYILLQAGAIVDIADLDGKTALILAVENSSKYKKKFRRTDIIQLLLQAGANPNIQDKNGKTALMYAAERNVTKFCEMLMNYSADVGIQDSRGKTAYMYVTDSQCLQVLLSPAANVTNCKFNYECGPVKSQNKKFYRPLPEYLNIKDKEGKTALMHAAMGDLTSCCKLLIDHCCNVNIQDNEGRTALMYASSLDCMIALMAGHGLNSFIQGDTVSNPNIQDHTGKTALMYAAERNVSLCCELLLGCYADANLKDNGGKTALMYASRRDTLHALLSGGADPKILDNSNSSILVQLLKRQQPISDVIDNVEVVLEHGGNPVLDPDSNRLFHLGFENPREIEYLMKSLIALDRRQMIRFLVCNGFITNVWQNRNFFKSYTSPLCQTLKCGHIDIAKYFVACCYLSESDLRDICRLASKGTQICGPDVSSDCESEISLFVQQIVSQPWPLVKLAFIAVSTALGVGADRSQKIVQTQLPGRLQRMLMFREPISLLPVTEWSNIPLCFDPSEYERMPRPRPLLYYWPFGRDMVI